MILVTGGAGFIGSVLVRALNELGHENIIVVDRLRDNSKWKNLQKCSFEKYIHADELFLQENEASLNSIMTIFHIGACSSTTEMNMDYLMKNNVEYSKKLYNLAQSKKIPFLYASSAATYGAGELGYDDEAPIKNLKPLNPYGYSKQLFDSWLLKKDIKNNKVYGFKYFNVYGPNEYHKEEMRSMVHKAFGQIKEKALVKLFKSHKDGFEDGMQLRDFIYVKDVVRAMIEFWNKDCESGIYNLGTGKARSFKDLVDATFSALNVESKVEYIDMPKSIRNQYQYFTEAKMTKFEVQLPNFKFLSLEEGVKDYVVNFLNKEDEYY